MVNVAKIMSVVVSLLLPAGSWSRLVGRTATTAFVVPNSRRVLLADNFGELRRRLSTSCCSSSSSSPSSSSRILQRRREPSLSITSRRPDITRQKRSSGLFFRRRGRMRMSCLYATGSKSNHQDWSIPNDYSLPTTMNGIDVPTRLMETLGQHILPAVLSNTNDETAISLSNQVIVLVLGVSGGCDSVALLHALDEYRQVQRNDPSKGIEPRPNNGWVMSIPLMAGQKRIQQAQQHTENEIHCFLHVIHFDHQQRGRDSDGDREYVQQLCTSRGIPLQIHYWSQQQGNKISTVFSQEQARNWRRRLMREYLDSLMEQYAASSPSLSSNDQDGSSGHDKNNVAGLLLTAHHQDDSDETLLLKVLRGSHLSNWKGLPVVTRDEQGYIWARPLMHVCKQDLMDYLVRQQVPWREDASNQSVKYLRNRVRNELIPLLKDLCGGSDSLRRRIDNIQEQSSELRQGLEQLGREYLRQSRSTYQYFVLPLPGHNELSLVHKEALHMWVTDRIGGTLQFTFEHVQRICQQITDYPENRQWRLNIGACYDIQRNGNHLLLIHPGAAPTESCSDERVPLRKRLHYSVIDSDEIAVDESALDGNKNDVESLTVAIPKDLLGSSVIDTNAGNCWTMTINPPWRDNPLKVKDLLRGQKVPLEDRASARVIILEQPDDNGINQDQIMAIFVVHKSQWIINKAFSPPHPDTENDDSFTTCSIDLSASATHNE